MYVQIHMMRYCTYYSTVTTEHADLMLVIAIITVPTWSSPAGAVCMYPVRMGLMVGFDQRQDQGQEFVRVEVNLFSILLCPPHHVVVTVHHGRSRKRPTIKS